MKTATAPGRTRVVKNLPPMTVGYVLGTRHPARALNVSTIRGLRLEGWWRGK